MLWTPHFVTSETDVAEVQAADLSAPAARPQQRRSVYGLAARRRTDSVACWTLDGDQKRRSAEPTVACRR